MSTFNPLTSYNFAETGAAAAGSNSPAGTVVYPFSPSPSNTSGVNGAFSVGQLWFDSVTTIMYVLDAVAGGVATWSSLVGASAGVSSVNSAAGNVIFVDGGTGAITFSGAGSSVMAAVQVDGTSIQITADKIGLKGPVSSSNGGTGVSSPTAHSLPVAEGASSFNFIGPLNNGQLLIGSSGADPVAASLTAGAGIAITPGPGGIMIASTESGSGVSSVNTATGAVVISDAGTGAITFSGAGSSVMAAVQVDGTSIHIASDKIAILGPVSAANGGTGIASPTPHAVAIGEGASPLNFVGPLANGQLLIGSTGIDPVAASLTAGTGIAITPGAGSITIAATGGGSGVSSVNTATGAVVISDAGTGAITFSGTGSAVTAAVQVDGTSIHIASDKVSLLGPVSTANGGTGIISPTAHTIPIAEGAAAFNLVGPLTNGQLLIGSSGADPVAASLTAGTGISIIPAAGSITISSTVTGITWTDQAASTIVTANSGSFVSAGTVTLTLPAAPSQGSICDFCVDSAGTLIIQANTGQLIRLGASVSSSAGTVTSTTTGDSMSLVYRAASATWISTSVNGNWTVS